MSQNCRFTAWKASELDDADPSIPFDCAQLLVLLLPPSVEARQIEEILASDMVKGLNDMIPCASFQLAMFFLHVFT